MGRWEDHVAIHRRISPRFAQHARAQVVDVAFEIKLFLEHRLPGYVRHATGDDATRLATGVSIDGGDHFVEAHGGKVSGDRG